jgi:hypothetical protein
MHTPYELFSNLREDTEVFLRDLFQSLTVEAILLIAKKPDFALQDWP